MERTEFREPEEVDLLGNVVCLSVIGEDYPQLARERSQPENIISYEKVTSIFPIGVLSS
jgi:hypothetical protein